MILVTVYFFRKLFFNDTLQIPAHSSFLSSHQSATSSSQEGLELKKKKEGNLLLHGKKTTKQKTTKPLL